MPLELGGVSFLVSPLVQIPLALVKHCCEEAVAYCGRVPQHAWGPRWCSQCFVLFWQHGDHMNKWAVRNPLLMHLLHALFFIEAHFSLRLRAEHVAGVSNSATDTVYQFNSEVKKISRFGRFTWKRQIFPPPSLFSIGACTQSMHAWLISYYWFYSRSRKRILSTSTSLLCQSDKSLSSIVNE